MISNHDLANLLSTDGMKRAARWFLMEQCRQIGKVPNHDKVKMMIRLWKDLQLTYTPVGRSMKVVTRRVSDRNCGEGPVGEVSTGK